MNRLLEYGIGTFHLCLFAIVAFVTFWMGVEKAGYEELANQRIEKLSQLSLTELGEVRVRG